MFYKFAQGITREIREDFFQPLKTSRRFGQSDDFNRNFHSFVNPTPEGNRLTLSEHEHYPTRNLGSRLFSLLLLNQFLNLFHPEQLSGGLYLSIYPQGRSHEDSGAGDCFNILDFDHFSIQAQLFDRFLDSLRELVALGSTHPQDFDLFHRLLLVLFYEIEKSPVDKPRGSTEENNQTYIDHELLGAD